MVRFRLLLFSAILLALFSVQCSHSSNSSNTAGGQQQGPAQGGRGQGRGGRGGPGGPGGFGGAMPVSAARVQLENLPIYLRGLGTVTAYNTVVVKSRVDGPLIRINFTEGQFVNKGQVLAEIDPRTFQATLDQAKANLTKDEASERDAQVNLARYEALAKEQVIAQQQLDTQRAQVGQFGGQIAADKAQIEAASLQLSFTKITAPITGRIGLRQVDVGNIIHASDPNGLAVITQLEPITALFTLPEDQLQTVMQAMQHGSLQAEAWSRDDKTKIATGKLLTVDNVIDPTTGTSRFKAEFPNKDHELWPNEFVNVRLLVQVKHNAMTIPSAALVRGASGPFVYVVKPDSTVESRNVQVGVTEGTTAEIASGLQPNEMVVTDGQDKLQNQAKVTIQPAPGQGRQGQSQQAEQSSADQNPQAAQSAQSEEQNPSGQRYYGGRGSYQRGGQPSATGGSAAPSGMNDQAGQANQNGGRTNNPQGGTPAAGQQQTNGGGPRHGVRR